MNNIKKHRINSWIVIAIAVVLVIVVNVFVTVLNGKFPLKVDLTSNKMYELSDKTYEYLETFDTPVNIYILASEADQDEKISSILRKYAVANSNIKVRNVNIAENPTFGKEYVTDGSSLAANSIIVDSGERFKLFSLTDLYGFDEQMGLYTSLNVENKITSALKYVSSDKQLTAYMINGHNELEVTGATNKLIDENYRVGMVNLLTEEIPADASLLMLVRPTVDFSDAEITKLDAYLSGGGNLQVYLDIDSQALTNLYKYLKSWGIGVNDDFVVETDMSHSVALGNSGMVLFVPVVKSTEFTDSIIENNRTLAYFSRSKSLSQEFEVNGSISVATILTSSDKSYTTTNEMIANTGDEKVGEFAVAMLAENSKDNSSVYVSGNTMLLTLDVSTLMYEYGLANYDYFMNLINYTSGNEESFMVSEKTLVNNVISVSEAGAVVIFVFIVIAIPVIILLCGLVVWFRRRNL